MNNNATMPTQRPFLSNFLAAFRAHNAIQSKATSPSSQPSHTPHASHQTTNTSPSNPRAITTSAKPGATTTALSTLHSPRTHSASPLSTSPGTQTPSTSPAAEQRGRYIASPQGRRGSDSSSEGFRDVLGAEGWYIGGRTAAGEEKYFKLGVVRRRRSGGSLSLDRLSL
jgi:hypothetical protein